MSDQSRVNEQGSDATARIDELIEERSALDELDLTAQVRVMEITRRLVDVLLTPKWLQTDRVLDHARLFFDEFQAPAGPSVQLTNDKTETLGNSLRSEIDEGDAALHDYYCYVLLDFASVDRELAEAPLAHAIVVAQSVGLETSFSKLAAKELKLRKRQFEKISSNRIEIVAAAAKSEATP